MGVPRCSDQEFIELFSSAQNAPEVADQLGVKIRRVLARRRTIEKRYNIVLKTKTGPVAEQPEKFPGRIEVTINDGIVLVITDQHYWPGTASVAHRGFVKFCRDLKPSIVIVDGDVMDGASISRHPPIGWENNPSVIQEIEVCQERLGEIAIAAGKARRYWCLGNHDSRFNTRLAQVAPEYARVKGTKLRDHFPDWEPCWSVDINNDVWVSHRFKGGAHAAYNNTIHAGRSTVTGHLHKGVVTPFTDLNGTRYGVDLPTAADPYGPQFQYQEDNPRNHRSGFGVLTFKEGEMLQPELAFKWDENRIQFRGELIEV